MLSSSLIGSRWYLHGEHYEITEDGLTRDGEPAVRIKNVNRAKAKARPIIRRLLERHGTRTA